ncbi:MAG: HEAT repeat domain-containing protein [Pirellulaceae bacterium]
MALAAIDPESLGIDFWREALKHKNRHVTQIAAEALGKIGPSAIGAVDDLFESLHSHQFGGLPQAYCEVLTAIMKIAPHDPRVLDAAKSGLAILEYYCQKAAATALLDVGTPEALDVLRNAYCIHPNAELVKRVHKLVEKRLPGFQFNPKPTANCPECGQQLRTFLAKQCFHCGAKWRKANTS